MVKFQENRKLKAGKIGLKLVTANNQGLEQTI